MRYGIPARFTAALGKKRADGKIVYSDNIFLNFLLKIWQKAVK